MGHTMKIGDPQVCKDLYEMTILLFNQTKKFPRNIRPTIARRIEEATLEATQTMRSYSLTPKKRKKNALFLLEIVTEKLEELNFLISG
jgi:hypothetical protein